MTALPLGDVDKLKTKYRLLEVAARQLALHGFEGASLRQIAADAGVSATAIYRHFPGGKADLYEATLGLVAEAVTGLVAETVGQERSAIDTVVHQVDRMWDFFADYPSIAAMVVRENITGGANGPSPYLAQHDAAIAGLRALFDEAIEAGGIRRVNVSDFLFWVTTYVTSFHGCQALRDATFTETDLDGAKDVFLTAVRDRLDPGERERR